MFKICRKCDFEWHEDDGVHCPVCSSHNDCELEKCDDESLPSQSTFQLTFNSRYLWVQALAIITLVVLLVIWI